MEVTASAVNRANDFMDELSCTSRLARRIALAATICCAATSGYADQAVRGSRQTQTLRTLLSQGWSDDTAADKKAADQNNKPAPKQEAVQAQPPAVQVKSPAIKTVEPTPKSVIVRPKLRVLEAPLPQLSESPFTHSTRDSRTTHADKVAAKMPARVVAKASPPSEPSKPSEQLTRQGMTSLAELIQRRTKPIIVPQQDSALDAMNIDAVPSVKRLDVEKQVAANIAKLELLSDSISNVRVADPIHAEPVATPPKPTPAVQSPAIAEAMPLKQFDAPPRPEAVAPAKTAVEAIAGSTTAESKTVESKPVESKVAAVRVAESNTVESSAVKSSIPETKSIASTSTESKPTISKLVETSPPTNSATGPARETTPSPTSSSPPSSSPPSLKASSSNAGDVASSSKFSDLSRRTAAHSGFSLLPLDDFESDSAVRLKQADDEPTLTVTIHARRLREIAQDSLRNAKHRLQRRATHSAKKYAMEALRSIVAMQDVQSGGNQHARQLEVAFDAIRESADFCGRFGVIDESALNRMVTVHETEVLKNQDITDFSALEATETYLAVAKKNLVLAAGDAREASDALILLGRIEKEMSPSGDTHASSVAVTLQRAAVEIEPNNAFGYRELGTTLLNQGLTEQAIAALNRSIEIQPTRTSYQRLLEASRRLGDIDTVRECLASLQNPELESEFPVLSLSPQAFAATHRPIPAAVQPAPVKPARAEAETSTAEVPKIGLRSLFPFGRN